MVFVLDNYDSFTYNLVQYMGELGAEMVIRRNDELTPAEVEALRPERILISPGPCTPQDAGISIELIRHFAKAKRRVPILGVCLGHQAIGAAFGGNVVRAAKLMHGKTSEVEHDGKTIFQGLPSAMTCTRYHSLIVVEEGLPEELEVSARAVGEMQTDGETIMALRHRELPIEGVQFHPESVLTSNGKKLMHGKTSEVEHDGKTIFEGLPSAMTCTRYHSLIVAEEGLPEELEVSARAVGEMQGDGETIMALRHRELPIEGVQFHPESVLTSNGKKLIENFLKM